MFRPVYPVPVELLLGSLYIGVKAEMEKKIFSICPKLLINTELYWPQG
jgi:hypothetical protein